MSDIKVFITKSEKLQDEESQKLLSWYEGQNASSTIYEPVIDGLSRQAKSLMLDIDIDVLDCGELPAKVDSKLVIVFRERCMISSKYLLNIVSLNNMFPKFSVLCGKIENYHTSIHDDFFTDRLSKFYMAYNLFESPTSVVCDISDEPSNLPPSYNICINSSTYNDIGGISPMKTLRGDILNNRVFVNSAASLGNVFYSSILPSKNILSERDMSMSRISKHFYELGYIAATSIKSNKEPVFERVWKQFVETPESLDHRILGRLTFEKEIPDTQRKTYAQKLAMVKCSYQCGLFEGLSGIELL